MALAAAAAMVAWLWPVSPSDAPIRSVAVLPFDNLGSDPATDPLVFEQKDKAFYTGKIAAAKFFAANVLPIIVAAKGESAPIRSRPLARFTALRPRTRCGARTSRHDRSCSGCISSGYGNV